MPKAKRKKLSEAERLEGEAFDRYKASGDVTGFLALADYLQERDARPEFVAMLREVAERKDRDVLFFYRNAGGSYMPDRETITEGSLRCAVRLAKAEDWYKANEAAPGVEGGVFIEWRNDPFYDPEDSDYPEDMPEFAWGCVLARNTTGNEWKTLESLWGITFDGNGEPWGKSYARVVEAELALEAMPD